MANSEITLDKRTELVWQVFKLYLPAGTRLTDVIRPLLAQLERLVSDAKNEGYAFKKALTLQNRSSWEPALSYLKSKKYDIAAHGSNMHGRGYAFDLAGPELNRIEQALVRAAYEKRIHLMLPRSNWPNPKVESKNRCVHVEIDAAQIDFEPFDFA